MTSAFKTGLVAILLGSASLTLTAPAFAHCEIPCGIYDDERAFDALEQHVQTIKRSLQGLSDAETVHDTTRWVINKENHAQKIQDEIAVYFLAQRIKPAASDAEGFDNYQKSLRLAHAIIVSAMKTKQSDGMEAANTLEADVKAYREHYFALHGHKH